MACKINNPPPDNENILTEGLRVKTISCSSCMKGSNGKNILSGDESMWMSEPGLPQSIVLDLGNNFKNHDGHTLKRNYTCFAFRCSHAYSSNPAKLELNFSSDGANFQTWVLISQTAFRKGTQYFSIPPLCSSRVKYLELVIKDSFGANRTYLSQVFLYADEKQRVKSSIQRQLSEAKSKAAS